MKSNEYDAKSTAEMVGDELMVTLGKFILNLCLH